MLHAEPLAGSPKAGDDFVRNHEHFVVIADVPYTLEPPEWWNNAAAGTQHRLEQNCSYGLRVFVGDRLHEPVAAAPYQFFFSSLAPVTQRVRDRYFCEAIPSQHFVRTREIRAIAYRKRAESTAVISAMQ